MCLRARKNRLAGYPIKASTIAVHGSSSARIGWQCPTSAKSWRFYGAVNNAATCSSAKSVPGILVGGLLDLGLYFADVEDDILGLWVALSRLVVVLDEGLAWFIHTLDVERGDLRELIRVCI